MPLALCPFCERLYSTHSLPYHHPKCRDNPNNNNKRRKSSSRGRKSKEDEEARPMTRSLSRNNPNVTHRICFVCGKGFSEEDLFDHESYCFRVWQQTAEHLAPNFVVKEPRRLNVPSVDETRDVNRENSLAREQSLLAQRVKCRSCRAAVCFWQAFDHVCHQPDVQFFIPQRG